MNLSDFRNKAIGVIPVRLLDKKTINTDSARYLFNNMHTIQKFHSSGKQFRAQHIPHIAYVCFESVE